MPLRMLRQKIMCSRPPKLHSLSQKGNRRGDHANVIFLLLCWEHALEGGTGVKDREIQRKVPKRAIGGTPPLGPEEPRAGEFCWKVLSHTGDQASPWRHFCCEDSMFPHSFLPASLCNLPLVLEDGKPVLVRGGVWTQC